MENIIEFIRPELLVLAVVAYVIGMILKNTQVVKDKMIPITLVCMCAGMALVYVFATADVSSAQNILMALFTGITQGVLCAGTAVLTSQVIKQAGK